MKSRLVQDGEQKTYVIVFETGDQVMSNLLAFANEHGIRGAHFTAIGAFQDATLGYFAWETKQYREIPVREQVEVLSLIGSVANHEGEPKVHAHTVVGTAAGEARGGHLFEAHVRPTLEVVLTEVPEHLRRRLDDESGLPLIDL